MLMDEQDAEFVNGMDVAWATFRYWMLWGNERQIKEQLSLVEDKIQHLQRIALAGIDRELLEISTHDKETDETTIKEEMEFELSEQKNGAHYHPAQLPPDTENKNWLTGIHHNQVRIPVA